MTGFGCFTEHHLVEKISARRQYWILSEKSLIRSTELLRLKREFLVVLFKNTSGFIINYSENPVEDGIRGKWEQLGKFDWALKSGLDADGVLDWLHLGNWVIYSWREQNKFCAYEFNHLSDPEKTAEEVDEQGLQFALHSFHDDQEWTFYLHDD